VRGLIGRKNEPRRLAQRFYSIAVHLSLAAAEGSSDSKRMDNREALIALNMVENVGPVRARLLI